MSVVLSVAGIGSKAIRVGEEFDRLLRITAWLRECLEAELAAEASLAKDKPAKIGQGILDKWSSLVTQFDKLTGSKVRLDKSAKALVEEMTPDEELEAVRAYVRSLEPKKREKFLRAESEYHALSMTPIARD